MNAFARMFRFGWSRKMHVSNQATVGSRKIVRRRLARCLFEALEPRVMLSAATTFSGGMASLPISRLAALTSAAAATSNAQTGYQLTLLGSMSSSSGYFNGVNGTISDGSFTMESNGTLVGNNASAAFTLAPGGQPTAIAYVAGTQGGPNALYLAGNGDFYGTTTGGGSFSSGNLFRITSSGAYTTLVNFNPATGATNTPVGSVVMDSSGNIYGVVNTVGYINEGGVFKYGTNGTLTTFASDFTAIFPGLPTGGLIMDGSGNLYGVASEASHNGVIYKVASNGAISALCTFNGTDGSNPIGNLVRDSAGNLYGVTEYGGSAGDGTIFKLAANGTLTTLVNFTGANGANPAAGLAMDSAGNLYGVTSGGGAYGYGTVYEISSGGTFTDLYNFSQLSAVFNPLGTPYISSSGNIYADASSGGSNAFGGVFELTPPAAVRPTITGASLVPISGTNNWQITINGSGFGTRSGYNNNDSPYLAIEDSTANFNAGYSGDAVTANVASWTDSQIVISGLAGAYGASGQEINAGDELAVDVRGIQTGLLASVFNEAVPPVISGVSVVSLAGSSNNWQITINGSGFGTRSGYNNNDSTYLAIQDNTGHFTAGYLGDPVTANVSSWNNTQIVISGLAGAYGTNGQSIHMGDSLTVDVANVPTGVAAAAVDIKVAPVISSVSVTPLSGSSGNWQITIDGSGFGTRSGYSNNDSPYLAIEDNTANFNAGYSGDAVTANVTSWTNTQIIISGLAGAYGTNGQSLKMGDSLAVDVANVPTGVAAAAVDIQVAPVISSVSVTPLSGSSNNWQITINGSNFGTRSGYSNNDSPYLAIEDNTANFNAGYSGDAITANVTSWTNTQIIISGLAGAYGTNGWVIAPGNALAVDVANVPTGVAAAVYSVTVA